MHIGGMRTALFNWLWARHNGGKFILRIDDTDRERNIDQAVALIFKAFRWLGLDWDEGPEEGGAFGPYFQSQRGNLYRQAAERLLADGVAYHDFDTTEQIRADREAAEREKRPYVNVRRSLELTEQQIEEFVAEGNPSVIRFLVPRNETVAIDDAVRGDVEWDAALIADPVIVRSDGSPLYNFATVVDDAGMQITDVIRAEEHLSNTPIQVLIHQALGNELPRFAHIPYVAAPGSKEKLSKREKKIEKYRKNPQFKRMFEAADKVFPKIGLSEREWLNPVMVEYYEMIGFLPEGVFNALSRLGWSLDDKTEIMSRETIIENFTLARVVKSPAGLDPEKLLSYQAHWMRQVPLEEKVAYCCSYLSLAGLIEAKQPEGAADTDAEPDEETQAYVRRLIEALGERLVLYSDILDYEEFFLADDVLPYDEKAFEKRIRKSPESVTLLAEFREQLAMAESFAPDELDKMMREFVENKGIKIGQVIHAVRVAVTGKATGPGMFDCLALLGRERCLARIDRALSRV
jgi:glutamyl-tRNA synthetase